MARECFCGCGQRVPKFPLGIRSINTRGRQVAERIDFVEEFPHLKNESPEIAAWLDEGAAIRTELQASVHGTMDPRTLDEGAIREWQAEGRNIEHFIKSHLAAVGKWATEKGYSTEEAQAAIARGEYQAPGS